MGLVSFPTSTNIVKSIQRGVAVSAGDITISSIDTSKSYINSFSTGASGTVGITGSLNASSGSSSGASISAANIDHQAYANNGGAGAGSTSSVYMTTVPTLQSPRYTSYYNYTAIYATLDGSNIYSMYGVGTKYLNAQNIVSNAANATGGTDNLIVGVNGAYIKNSTTITVSGPCRYEVVEYY